MTRRGAATSDLGLASRRRVLAAGVWLGASMPWPALAAPAVALSPALVNWLAEHPQVRFAPERDYGPFVFEGRDGVVQGLSVDMLALVRQRLGLPLVTVPSAPLGELLAAARRRDVDLLSSLRPTPERGEFLLFTRPYVSVPAVLVLPASASVSEHADVLLAMQGRRVAVGAGYAVESVVRERHPRVQWQQVSDDAVALRGVAQGQFEGAVVDAASLAFVSREAGLQGRLRTAGRVGFEYALSFAVRSDWPQLRDLLDAGIGSLSSAERQAVLDRWMPTEAPPRHAPQATRLAAGLLAVAGAVVAGLLWWRRRTPPGPSAAREDEA